MRDDILRNEPRQWVLCLLTLLLWLTSLGTAQAASSTDRDHVVTLVRSLGYGAGIHNFKNFVLRGSDENYEAAKKAFDTALASLNRLEKSPESTVEDRAAVTILKDTVEEYNRGLDRIVSRRNKGWRLGDVDRSVYIDDTLAIASLAQLRGKWDWSDLEQIEYLLGYGKGIHNFKNYLLRQDERYHTQALENFLAVESLLANQYGNASLNESQQTALEKIRRVTESYRNYLSLIDRFHTQQYPVRKIDLAVKINDRPAIEGLKAFRR